MPKEKWTGYERSCPFAKGLDVIGERWTLLIIHELFGGGLRYGELNARLPGISTNVLADRLRKLEDASVIGRAVGDPGDGVRYELTDRGLALGPTMAEIRRWGVAELVSVVVGQPVRYDMAYAIPDDLGLDEAYEWRIDDDVVTFVIEGQTLTLTAGPVESPVLVLHTSHHFLRQWAAGERNWEAGLHSGAVVIDGPDDAWDRMQIATNYPGRAAGLLSPNHPAGTVQTKESTRSDEAKTPNGGS